MTFFFLTPFVGELFRAVLDVLDPDLNFEVERPNAGGQIPDHVVFKGNHYETFTSDDPPDNAILVGDAKVPPKYPPKIPRTAGRKDIIDDYNDPGGHDKEHCPIVQIFGYMCVSRTKYGYLTTGRHTWFLRRCVEQGQEILEISKAYMVEGERSSLAQAFACILTLAATDSERPKTRHDGVRVKVIRGERSKERRQRSLEYAKNKEEQRNEDETTLDDEVPSSGGGTSARLPLEDAEFSLADRSDEYGPLNHGIAVRVLVHGIDAVVKLVDAIKDRKGAAILRAEAEIYKELRDLWGSCIPSLVFGADLNLGRYGLATTYAGPTLEDDASLLTPDNYEQVVSAVRTLHAAGYVHGDLAQRNIAVFNGKATLIDLGSARRTHDTLEFERELQQVAELCRHDISSTKFDSPFLLQQFPSRASKSPDVLVY